ncbi:MAG: hypothetical protein WAU12_08765 [Saprospiraceae bacterium]|jgi:hypothetical protein|uniref:DUF6922 domain-containing protein n=1 Tax=Candidatus Brachybacter algidus TaxID=2982024 RepID=UPI001B5D48B8|nr:hypothetical protein [Candidatus Brachybacter algidus]MBP7306666.1 hypothetical protein [Saprospiraceae bacterium]MBP9758311.1 hypothetical protein [Candidatus Dojkabacteria bacterium]MBK6450646.1 hypothetical protein [Candidatus Brachybacter algidus]MBK7604748.1 hypothetical protein [Candidatus Brachybacter algidus]MBK8748453.1 hypothetical protein [Candidatus Brachybacter algidus]
MEYNKVDTEKYKLTDLSPQLFWDTRVEDVDWDDHSAFIVERVLEYGMMKDWKMIREVYGLERIISISMKLRYLSPKSLSFMSAISGKNQNEFRCYVQRQLNQGHWIY